MKEFQWIGKSMDSNRKLLPLLMEELLGQGYFLINNNAGLMGQITTHYQPINATRSLYFLYLENNGERLSPEVRFTLEKGQVIDREIPHVSFPQVFRLRMQWNGTPNSVKC